MAVKSGETQRLIDKFCAYIDELIDINNIQAVTPEHYERKYYDYGGFVTLAFKTSHIHPPNTVEYLKFTILLDWRGTGTVWT